MLSAFLQLDGTLRNALSELANRRERRDCIVRTREMSVMCLFFSPNKLIDYSPAICIRLLTSTRYLHTSVKQIRNLRPTFTLLRSPLLLITNSKLERGLAQRGTKREGCLHLPSRTYCRFTERTRLISLPCLRSAICRTCHCTLLRLPDFLCCVVASRRIRVLQLVYTVRACHV